MSPAEPVAGAAKLPEGSKAQIAREHIRSRIADGTYRPGTRLVLGQIARELNVSPVPVREAVRMLEAEGTVTYAHNIGPQVAILDVHLYQDTMQTLALVEGYATALSAPHLTAEDLAEARELNAGLRQALAEFDPAAFTQLNGAFHRVVTRRCPNDHIADLCERGWARLQTFKDQGLSYVPGRAPSAIEEHEEIVRLIETGAPADDVERAARNHRLRTLDAFLARTAAERDGLAAASPAA